MQSHVPLCTKDLGGPVCSCLGEGAAAITGCAGWDGVVSSVLTASVGSFGHRLLFFPESGVLTQSQKPLEQITGGNGTYQNVSSGCPERTHSSKPCGCIMRGGSVSSHVP